MYLDSAYLAKYYINEPDSVRVRKAIHRAKSLTTSAWSIAEVTCVFHRHLRQGGLSESQFQTVSREFLSHVDDELWTVVPVTGGLLRRVVSVMGNVPSTVFIRAGDAVQLVSALEADEPEIWTNDRHMLAAAPHFGLVGRSV